MLYHWSDIDTEVPVETNGPNRYGGLLNRLILRNLASKIEGASFKEAAARS
jgi:hypothetical protein